MIFLNRIPTALAVGYLLTLLRSSFIGHAKSGYVLSKRARPEKPTTKNNVIVLAGRFRNARLPLYYYL